MGEIRIARTTRPRFAQAASAAKISAREAIDTARLVARNWANRSGDSSRTHAARAFSARVVDAYATRTLTRTCAELISQPPIPSKRFSLDRFEEQLADQIGAAAADLAVIEAVHLLGGIYSVMLPDGLRARSGSYYTPPALAHRLCEMAAESGVDWTSCRVLDPACGAGVLLACAALRMLKELAACEPAIVVQNLGNRLHGFEIDEFAAWMAQAIIEIILGPVCAAAGRRLPRLITVCDSLDRNPGGQRYDLVIGNPPYGRVTLAPSQRERFKEGLFGHANLYGVFTDLALRWTNAGGVIAYVTPTSFLAGEYFKALRELLAREAPPTQADFIHARRGVFEDVLQEAVLATYNRGGSPGPARVNCLTLKPDGTIAIERTGTFRLPAAPREPWVLPRLPDQARFVARLVEMRHRLSDWGYTVSTGPLVWNRHKPQLRLTPAIGTFPLIWAEAVSQSGKFAHRAEKRNHKPFFQITNGDAWLKTDRPCVLVQRTTAKEQRRRLIAAELPENLIAEYGAVIVENHLNMVRPKPGTPKITPTAVAAILNSDVVDRAFRCISGSVAVSAFELEALPLPSVEDMRSIEHLVAKNAARDEIEQRLRAIYEAS